jgi:hypothetical protein
LEPLSRILQAVLETISSSHVKWIPLRCFSIAGNNQKSDGATARL